MEFIRELKIEEEQLMKEGKDETEGISRCLGSFIKYFHVTHRMHGPEHWSTVLALGKET